MSPVTPAVAEQKSEAGTQRRVPASCRSPHHVVVETSWLCSHMALFWLKPVQYLGGGGRSRDGSQAKG